MASPRGPRLRPIQEMPPTARLLGIGFYVGICIGGLAALGYLGDGQLDTKPVLTLVGLALGLIFAFWGGYIQLMDVLADLQRRRTGERNK